MQEEQADLERAEVFGALGGATRQAISAIGHRETLDADAHLFRQGDPGEFVFVLLSGSLEVRITTDSGAEVGVATLEPGSVGGLTSVSSRLPRSASVVAREPCQIFKLEREPFLEVLSEDLELSRAIIGHLSTKMRGESRAIASLRAEAGADRRIQVAFFDTKPYDRASFQPRAVGDWNLKFIETRLGPETAALAAGCPVVCAFVNDQLDAPVIRQLAASGVEHIAMRCAGYNNVDLAEAQRHGLSVTRVPAYSPYAVAEHAVALILALNRKVHRAHSRVREGNFTLQGLVGFDLAGKTAGIVGFGKIGQCLARILRGFSMEVLAMDAYPDEATAEQLGVTMTGLEDLLRRSHVVSLHAPLTPDTYHLIGAESLALMQQGSVLINTSRGGLVDATALVEALKTGRLGAAGLDVYEEESEYFFEDRSDQVITDDLLARLMTFNNVLITSHQAFLTEEALGNIADTTLFNIDEYLQGKRGAELTNGVNK